MRQETKTFTVYNLEDVKKDKALLQKVLENYSNINVDHNWYNDTLDEVAKSIGLKITSFDLDRNRHAKGNFIEDANFTANKILTEHGEICETFKTAQTFLNDWKILVEKYSDGITKDKVSEDNEAEFDNEANDLESEFLTSLLEDYSIILQKEYEYLQSDKAILETLEANDYEFGINGKIF